MNNVFPQFGSFIADKHYQDQREFNNFLDQFSLRIAELEETCSRSELLEQITEIRVACSESPFLERAQKWPRGYQGDFETINYIIRSKNHAEDGSFGHVVEDLFLNSDICQQHRNKVARQAQLIRRVIGAKSDARIISIGCGGSQDLRSCLDQIQGSDVEITLVDVDQDALDFSLLQLSQIAEKITPLQGNIYKRMRGLTEQYDLILIGGVFDYLNDKTIISVLKSLKENLAEGGKLFFTNIDAHNPYRIYMEYFTNWTLIERTASDLERLIKAADWPDNSFSITKDQTGLTHLVEMNYPQGRPLDSGTRHMAVSRWLLSPQPDSRRQRACFEPCLASNPQALEAAARIPQVKLPCSLAVAHRR